LLSFKILQSINLDSLAKCKNWTTDLVGIFPSCSYEFSLGYITLCCHAVTVFVVI